MGNKFEIVKHVFLDAQAATSGGIMGYGIMHPGHPDIATMAIGLAIGAYGALTINKIQQMQSGPADVRELLEHEQKK